MPFSPLSIYPLHRLDQRWDRVTYSGCVLPTVATCWGNLWRPDLIWVGVAVLTFIIESVRLLCVIQECCIGGWSTVINFVALSQVYWWLLNSSENTTMVIRPACQDQYFTYVFPVLFRHLFSSDCCVFCFRLLWLLCFVPPVSRYLMYSNPTSALCLHQIVFITSVCKLSRIPCLPCLSESHLTFTAPQIKESVGAVHFSVLVPEKASLRSCFASHIDFIGIHLMSKAMIQWNVL